MTNNLFRKEIHSIPSVKTFRVKGDGLYVQSANAIEVFSLLETKIKGKFKINDSKAKGIFVFNQKLIVQYSTSIKIYDEYGEFIMENFRYPSLKSAQLFKRKLLFQTFDQLRNKKRYLTEFDLETKDSFEWEWVYKSYDKLVGYFNTNLIVSAYDLDLKKYFLRYIQNRTGELIWEICLDDFNPKIKTRIDSQFKILNNSIVFYIGDLLVGIDIITGNQIWKTNNLGFPWFNTSPYNSSIFHFWKDKAYIIPYDGDYVVIDLGTGKEINRIKNWFDGLSYKRNTSRWEARIKIYDNFFMIADISIGSNLIHFFDKQTGKEIYKFELDEAVRWGREDYEYFDGKLFVKTADKEDGPYKLRIFELQIQEL